MTGFSGFDFWWDVGFIYQLFVKFLKFSWIN